MSCRHPELRSQSLRAFFLIVLAGSIGWTPVLAEGFPNLEVLPKDIEQRELTETMQGYSRSLGVKCEHCHVGTEGTIFSDYDFESEDNPNKEIARQMIRMTQQINETLMPKTGRDPVLEVTCTTCHRGQARPISLEKDLAQILADKGSSAAIERYRQLREKWYGRGTLDFGVLTLRRLASQLIHQKKYPEATAILELNLEHYPESIETLIQLGSLYQRAKKIDLAKTTYQRALEIDPENASAKRKLRRLEK